jgi:hypothetical protein
MCPTLLQCAEQVWSWTIGEKNTELKIKADHMPCYRFSSVQKCYRFRNALISLLSWYFFCIFCFCIVASCIVARSRARAPPSGSAAGRSALRGSTRPATASGSRSNMVGQPTSSLSLDRKSIKNNKANS